MLTASLGTPGPITPVITVPAAPTGGALPETYECNPFPEGVSTSSILCPGLANIKINPGTVSIAFTSGEPIAGGYYSGNYAFSVATLVTENGGTTTSTIYEETITSYETILSTLSGTTTTTVQGNCPSGSVKPTVTAQGSGSAVTSRSVASSGSVKPPLNSTLPHPTGSLSPRPSGSVSPSGTAQTPKFNATRATSYNPPASNSRMLHSTGSPSSRLSIPSPFSGTTPTLKLNSTFSRLGTGVINPSSNNYISHLPGSLSFRVSGSVSLAGTAPTSRTSPFLSGHDMGSIKSSSKINMTHPTGSFFSRLSGSVLVSGIAATLKSDSPLPHRSTVSIKSLSSSNVLYFSSSLAFQSSRSSLSQGNTPYIQTNSTALPYSSGSRKLLPSSGVLSPSGTAPHHNSISVTLHEGTASRTLSSPSLHTTQTHSSIGSSLRQPPFSPSASLQHNSSGIDGLISSRSNIQTIINPNITSPSTSTHIGTATVTTIIKTYIPCSSDITGHASKKICAGSLTESFVTKTITSMTTEYKVIRPATKGSPQTPRNQPAIHQPPKKTLLITKTRYTCPTFTSACPTEISLNRRDSGFGGPDYTLSGGDSGPTITSKVTETTNAPSTVTTLFASSTIDERSTITISKCGSSGTGPYASSFRRGDEPRLPPLMATPPLDMPGVQR